MSFFMLVSVPVCVMLSLPSCLFAIGSSVLCVMFWLLVLVMYLVSHWFAHIMWPSLFTIRSHVLASVSFSCIECINPAVGECLVWFSLVKSSLRLFVFWIALYSINLRLVDSHYNIYSGAKKYLVSHQLCKFSQLKRWERPVIFIIVIPQLWETKTRKKNPENHIVNYGGK